MPNRQNEDLDPDDNEYYSDELDSEDEHEELDAPRLRTASAQPAARRTIRLRRILQEMPAQEISFRCRQVIEFMNNLELDLPTFLNYVSWGLEETIEDPVIRYARTALMVSDELPHILQKWHQPPRIHDRGIRTQGARTPMTAWAENIIKRKINKEMRALAPLTRSAPEDLTEEMLLDIKLSDMITRTKAAAPTLWSILQSASYTPLQAKRNTYKTPDTVHHLIHLHAIIWP